MTAPCVHILMAVYNGAAHLPAQLASLADQDHANWHLWASVDASNDASDDIIAQFGTSHGVTARPGPARGAAANFVSLCRAAPAGEIWAFADQDDIWMAQKLSRAIDLLGDCDTPVLYCGRSKIADADGRAIANRHSPLQPHPPSFANALVQNIAGGNTFVMNPAATRLIADAAARVGDVVVHDWWVYQLVTGAGGRVIFDHQPHILYRQHAGNIIGANDGWRARAARVALIWDGTWRRWIDTNITALNATRDLLDADSRTLLNRFVAARRTTPAPARLRALRACGIYRQSRGAGAAMWVAAALGRL